MFRRKLLNIIPGNISLELHIYVPLQEVSVNVDDLVWINYILGQLLQRGPNPSLSALGSNCCLLQHFNYSLPHYWSPSTWSFLITLEIANRRPRSRQSSRFPTRTLR